MKRALLFLLALALLGTGLTGCGGTATATAPGSDTPSVVCTVFPLWDWTRNLLGDRAEARLLMDSGVDMHSFQPGVDDMVAIASCDLLIYVGGESDDWIADALAERTNPRQVALNLMEVLGEAALAEETVEGMQGPAEAENENDEHIWLSLGKARTLCAAIAEALCRLDPAGAESYRSNLSAYDGALAKLEADYASFSAALHEQTPDPYLIFADRFPFRYLTTELDLGYYAAFSGCSAETEASFETVAFLTGKAEALGVPAIFVTESPIPGVAETVVRSAGTPLEIKTLDSLQSVNRARIEAGATYLGIMEGNLETLRGVFRTEEG